MIKLYTYNGRNNLPAMHHSASIQHELVLSELQTLVVIDEHDIIPFSLRVLFEAAGDLKITGSAPDLPLGLQLIAEAQPDLAIAEIGGTGRCGMHRVEAIVRAQSPRPVLVLSAHDEIEYGEDALRAGASGYVMKDNACGTLIPACRTVLAGHTWISARLKASMMNRQMHRNFAGRSSASAPLPLQARDRQVLACLGQGMSTKEIATALNISDRAVDVCRARLKAKLQLRSGSELIAYASAHH